MTKDASAMGSNDNVRERRLFHVARIDRNWRPLAIIALDLLE